MKNFLWTTFVVCFGLFCSSVALEINYGIYQDLRISVSDNVPRQKCQRALDNLEVRPIFYSLLVKSVSKLYLQVDLMGASLNAYKGVRIVHT